jgi:hypothetical protein
MDGAKGGEGNILFQILGGPLERYTHWWPKFGVIILFLGVRSSKDAISAPFGVLMSP